MHGESNATIFRTTRGHPRSPEVTRGQKLKFLKIGQMTYQIEGNCTGNRMQLFLTPPEVTQGHPGSPKVKNRNKIQNRSNDLQNSRKLHREWNVTIFCINQGHSKLARRASTSEPNWHERPVDQAQTGPKGQYIRTKLARRASRS